MVLYRQTDSHGLLLEMLSHLKKKIRFTMQKKKYLLFDRMNKLTREIYGCHLPNIPFSQSCGEGVISNDIVIDTSVKNMGQKCKKVADQMKLMKSQVMQYIDASNSSLDSLSKNLRNFVTTASLGLGVVEEPRTMLLWLLKMLLQLYLSRIKPTIRS